MELCCFICNLKLTQLEQYCIHLKICHSLKSNSIYKCGVINCSQQFTSFRSFSKHMKSKINNSSYLYSEPFIKENLSTNVPMEVNLSDYDCNTNSEVQDDFSHVPLINMHLLKDSVLKFTLPILW